MEQGETAESVLSAPILHNLGSYDELNRRCRDVFPLLFDGARITVRKDLSSHFQISHALSISQQSTAYRFGATYVGSNQIGPGESYPVLFGETDLSGNTSATVLHQFKNNIHMKIQSQVQQGQLAAVQGTLEHRGRLATSTLTMANIDIVNNSGILVGQYLRKLTERFDIGAELVYHYGKQSPGGHRSILAYAARYTHSDWIGSMIVGAGGIKASYFHKQHPNLSFGVECETNFLVQESVTTLAYQAEIPEEGVVMRASIDTNWTVGGVLEKRLSQMLPFTLAISGMIDHVKNAGIFGIGLLIG